MGIPFSKFKPFCAPFVLEWKFLGRRPKPALLFFIAKKDPAGRTLQAACKKASPEPPSAGQTYFEPGVLQLPTVKQIKRLYNSVQNRFYKHVLKGAVNNNGNNTTNGKQQQRQTAKRQRQKHQRYIFSTQNSAGVVLNTFPRLNTKTFILPTRFISFFCGRIIC